MSKAAKKIRPVKGKSGRKAIIVTATIVAVVVCVAVSVVAYELATLRKGIDNQKGHTPSPSQKFDTPNHSSSTILNSQTQHSSTQSMNLLQNNFKDILNRNGVKCENFNIVKIVNYSNAFDGFSSPQSNLLFACRVDEKIKFLTFNQSSKLNNFQDNSQFAAEIAFHLQDNCHLLHIADAQKIDVDNNVFFVSKQFDYYEQDGKTSKAFIVFDENFRPFIFKKNADYLTAYNTTLADAFKADPSSLQPLECSDLIKFANDNLNSETLQNDGDQTKQTNLKQANNNANRNKHSNYSSANAKINKPSNRHYDKNNQLRIKRIGSGGRIY